MVDGGEGDGLIFGDRRGRDWRAGSGTGGTGGRTGGRRCGGRRTRTGGRRRPGNPPPDWIGGGDGRIGSEGAGREECWRRGDRSRIRRREDGKTGWGPTRRRTDRKSGTGGKP